MHLPLIGGTAPRLLPPCPSCGFPTPPDARQCADCGAPQRGWGRRVGLPAPPLAAQAAALAARQRDLLARQGALERARTAALERGRVALLSQIEANQERLGALLARANAAHRAVAARRAALLDAADLAEVARWIQRDRPSLPPEALGSVAIQRRWREATPCQGIAVDPRGRHVALVGGGKVVVVDVLTQRGARIDASGAAGVSFSADGRLLHFPDGRLWSLHARTWEPVTAGWRWRAPSPELGSMVALATLPHDAEVAAPDPRWSLEARGPDLLLQVRGAEGVWRRVLRSLPAAPRHLYLDGSSGLLVVSLRDEPLVEIYALTSAPALCWDAWRVRTQPPALAPLAHAQILAAEVDALAPLAAGADAADLPRLQARLTLAVVGARLLGEPGLVALVVQAGTEALTRALARLLSTPGQGRAAQAERLGAQAQALLHELAETTAGVSAATARLRWLVEQVPGWADALAVEDASDALLELVGGGALQVLQTTLERPAEPPLALAEVRLEPPDPHAALAELAALGRDLDAQLAALGEVEPSAGGLR